MLPDKVDKQIINLLQENSKTTIKEMSVILGLSITPIYERIKRLERAEIILNYSVNLDKDKLGFSLVAYCTISLKEHSKKYLEKFESEIVKFDEILECQHISGMSDYFLKIVSKDMPAYQYFIANELAGLENIGQVHSFFVMKEIKNSKRLPIE